MCLILRGSVNPPVPTDRDCVVLSLFCAVPTSEGMGIDANTCGHVRQVEQALEQLRRAAAARDVRALRRAIADCADAGASNQRDLSNQ